MTEAVEESTTSQKIINETLSKTSSRLMLSVEVVSTVFSLIVLIWQFSLAVLINQQNQVIQLTRSYQFIQNNLINFEMVADIKVIDSTNETCSQDNSGFITYSFRSIYGINNTCIQKEKGYTVLRFESECVEEYPLTNKVVLSNIINNYMMCYTTYPKRNFVYHFREISQGRCNDGEMLCGTTKTSIICVESNTYITKCPVSGVKFYKNQTDVEENFYVLQKLDKISQPYMAYSNYTSEVWPYMSVRLKYETFNDHTFYQFYDSYGYLYNYSASETFSMYYLAYDPLSDDFDINPNYKGKVSDFAYDQFKVKATDYLSWTDIVNVPKVIVFYETIDPSLYITLRTNYFPVPKDPCIEYLFLNNTANNSRGLFSVLSDASFDFLSLNLSYYISWNFIQAGTLFIYAFIYRVSTLSDKINNIIHINDRRAEKITVITFKIFYYISLGMKLMLLYNLNNYTRSKVNFIEYLVKNSCFDVTDTQLGTKTLLQLNMEKFLDEPSLNSLDLQSRMIFKLTFVEICNEVISIILYIILTKLRL